VKSGFRMGRGGGGDDLVDDFVLEDVPAGASGSDGDSDDGSEAGDRGAATAAASKRKV
jgi:hypothetical protein